MVGHNRKRSFTLRGAALCAALTLGAGARPAAAQPFAYVTNANDGTVSVIDTATNTVRTGAGFPLAVGSGPNGVAVTPDGKHAYVANGGSNNVSVIDTATNTVEAATLAVGSEPIGIAVTPDGKHVYVVNGGSNTVSVIDTATNTVEAATLTVGIFPHGVAVTPDGKHAYVTNAGSNTVSVIDTATNMVEATPLHVGNFPAGVVVTPDGTHAYVANKNDGTVSVIDTATNTVEAATLDVGDFPSGVAVTPDGKHAYVTSFGIGPLAPGTVSVIDTATKTVEVPPLKVGIGPQAVGIYSQGEPFATFKAKLAIDLGSKPNTDSFDFFAEFTLGQNSNGINPPAENVILEVGTFATTIPPGSFKGSGSGPFFFVGVVNGVDLVIGIVPTGAKRYAFGAAAQKASLTGTVNPVPVTLTIGDDSGTTLVNADIDKGLAARNN